MDESWHSLHDNTRASVEYTDTVASLGFRIVSPELYVKLNEILSVITLTIALPGLFVHFLNVKTFLMMGIEDGVSVTLLTLSMADFAFTIAAFFLSSASLLSSREVRDGLKFYIDPFAIQIFCGNVGVIVYNFITLVTVYLATVRCLCVAKPLQFKDMFTRSKSTVALLSLAVIVICGHVPILAHMGVQTKFDTKVNRTRLVLWMSEQRDQIKDIVRVTFASVSFFSEIVVVICVFIMISKLRQSVKFRMKRDPDKNDTKKGAHHVSGKERAVVVQVVVISIVFATCNACKICMALFAVVNTDFDMGKPYQFFYLIMSASRTAFNVINSSVNFFIYYTFNSKFRKLCFTFKCK